MKSLLRTVRTMQDAVDVIATVGFLPFFNNAMPGYGFSLEECCVPEKWFADGDGPWEWKGPLIRELGAAYGKFFRTKAGWITAEWFADFANARGGLMAFDERWYYGMASEPMRVIYDLLDKNGPLLTKEIRSLGGFGTRKQGGRPGFETALTKMQMMGYVTTSDIEYETTSAGERYGWGVARMALAEAALPVDLDELVQGRTPEQSQARILNHLEAVLPNVPSASLAKLMAPGSSAVRTGRTDRKGNARPPRAWLVPANPRYFDLEGHLSAHSELTWKQSTAILPGDEVFLYVTAPASEVRWRLEVLETDLPATGAYEMRVDRLMRLRLLQRIEPAITREQLQAEGVTHVRGPRHLPSTLWRQFHEGQAS